MEEDSGATEGNCAKGIPDFGMEGAPKRLPAGLDYKDHSGAEDGDVAVAALEGGDGGLITGGDRVEGFAALYSVMEYGGLAGRGFGVVPWVLGGNFGTRDWRGLPGVRRWLGGD
jgi:hypothetical protein